MGIAVVGRIATQEAERSCEPPGAVFLGAIVAGAPDIDHDEAGVVGSVLAFERGLELGVVEHRLFAFDLLVDGHRGLNARDVLPGKERGFRERQLGFVAAVGRIIEEDNERFAGNLAPRLAGVDVVFARFLEADGDESRRGCNFVLRAKERDRGLDFRRAQRR